MTRESERERGRDGKEECLRDSQELTRQGSCVFEVECVLVQVPSGCVCDRMGECVLMLEHERVRVWV